jgi:molecular chaperone GrpE
MAKSTAKEKKHQETIESAEEKEKLAEDNFNENELSDDETDVIENEVGEGNGSAEIEESVEKDISDSSESGEDQFLQTEITLEEKLKEYEEQNLRIRAEFANYKRRVEREQTDFIKFIKGEILKNMLPVLDDFKMMLEKSSNGENEQSVLEGAKLIYEKLRQVLEKEGLEKVNALGEKFDPDIHEALMMKPIDDKEEHDKVLEVFLDGFKLQNRLLRPSKVIVGKYENNQS